MLVKVDLPKLCYCIAERTTFRMLPFNPARFFPIKKVSGIRLERRCPQAFLSDPCQELLSFFLGLGPNSFSGASGYSHAIGISVIEVVFFCPLRCNSVNLRLYPIFGHLQKLFGVFLV